MKNEKLLEITNAICARGTRAVAIGFLTECKETGGMKRQTCTAIIGTDGVTKNVKNGYVFAESARGNWVSQVEMLNSACGKYTNKKGITTFYLFVETTTKKNRRTIYTDKAGKVCAAPSFDSPPAWTFIPYKASAVRWIKLGGKVYR